MAHKPPLEGLSRHLPAPSPLSLKAREHSSLYLKRIFDQINSFGSNSHSLGSIEASELFADGSQSFPAQDFVHRSSRRKLSTHGDFADVELSLATGTRQETRNVLSVKRSLQAGMGKASKSEGGSRLGYEQETRQASLQNTRCNVLESFTIAGNERIESSQSEQELDINSSKRSAFSNLQESSVQESTQRAVPSSSPAFSFQTRQSDASDHNLGSEFIKHIKENMQATTSYARQKSSTPSYIADCSRKPTAQLTIFYGGMVHVYDDVSAEKAHAIMLLAGNNNYSSNAHFENATAMAAPSSGALAGTSATRGLGVQLKPPGFSNAAVSFSSFPAKMKQRLFQDAELPFARKASLARFFEKRKDRVQAKAAAKAFKDAIEKEDSVSDQSANPKRLCIRPASLPPTPFSAKVTVGVASDAATNY